MQDLLSLNPVERARDSTYKSDFNKAKRISENAERLLESYVASLELKLVTGPTKIED